MHIEKFKKIKLLLGETVNLWKLMKVYLLKESIKLVDVFYLNNGFLESVKDRLECILSDVIKSIIVVSDFKKDTWIYSKCATNIQLH